MGLAQELAELFRRDITRLSQEVQAFPDDHSLWRCVPGITNSAGNLTLHLEGNLREFIGRQLGQIDYQRRRPLEFSLDGIPRSELILRLEQLKGMIPAVIAGMPAASLESTYPEHVLGIPLSTRQFLMHLLGHLSYHLGQIDYLRRVLTQEPAVEFARLQG